MSTALDSFYLSPLLGLQLHPEKMNFLWTKWYFFELNWNHNIIMKTKKANFVFWSDIKNSPSYWILQASFETEVERKKVVDPVVLGSCSQESLSVIISITKKCFCGDSWARPSFEDVLWHLQYAAQVQANAQRPVEAVSFNRCWCCRLAVIV